MKKPFKPHSLTMFRFALLFSACLLIVAGINSCKKEKYQTDSGNETPTSQQPAKKFIEVLSKKITFQSFLDSTKNVASGNLNKLMSKAQVTAGQLKINDAGPNNNLILFVDSIKQINSAGHQTFTFPVKQTSIYDVSFRNLVIDVYDNNVSAFLTTYTPDATYISNYKQGIKGKFSGKVHLDLFDLYNTSGGSIQVFSTRLKTMLQLCTTMMVYNGSYAVPCTCGHHHMPWQTECGCEGAGGTGPYWQDTYMPVTTCEDITLPPSGGGGDGGGGGPTTPPTTPPDYDPCPPVNVASSGLKTQLVDGGSPCTPAPLPDPHALILNTLIQNLNISDYTIQSFLNNNFTIANELYNYLQTNGYSGNNTLKANEYLSNLMNDANYLSFVNNHSASSSSNTVWWVDNTWLDTPGNFSLNLNDDDYSVFKELNNLERAVLVLYPYQGFIISKNRPIAFAATVSVFRNNLVNDKSDAFRHAFFNAINERDCGATLFGLGTSIAKLFSDAHESATPPNLILEAQMDLYNNTKGQSIPHIPNMDHDNNSYVIKVIDMLTHGDLHYLSPLDFNYFHGIIPGVTTIIPTDQ